LNEPELTKAVDLQMCRRSERARDFSLKGMIDDKDNSLGSLKAIAKCMKTRLDSMKGELQQANIEKSLAQHLVVSLLMNEDASKEAYSKCIEALLSELSELERTMPEEIFPSEGSSTTSESATR
jgi:hypothetical protein